MPDRTRNRTWCRVPTVVLAATLAFGALAAAWSVAMPLTEAPDEAQHLALVLYLADGNDYPAYDGLRSPTAVFRLCTTYGGSNRVCPPAEPDARLIRRHPAAEAPPKARRPAWDDAGGTVPVGRLNQMPQHPPLYYQAMAGVLRVERAVLGGPRSLDQELALLRLVNVLLIAPLPILAWWGAKRFGLDDPTALGAAFVPFALPMLTHIGSTLNNDNLLTLCGAVLAALLAGVSRGDRSRRTAVGVGLVTGLALLTKAFAVVYPPLIVLAYLVGARRRAQGDDDAEAPAVAPGWRPAILGLAAPLATAGLVTGVVAAWWYIGVRARTGQFAPTTETVRYSEALRPPGFEPHLTSYLGTFLRLLDVRFWGSFGWYTLTISNLAAYAATAVVVAAGVSALATRTTPGARSGAAPASRLAVASLLAPLVALGAFVFLRAWDLHRTTGQLPFIQGRYLFAGLIGLAVVVAIGVRRFAGRWTPVAVLGFAAVVQVGSGRRVVADFWGGPGLGPRGQVRAMVAWSGWPGELLGLGAVLAVASVVALGWTLVGAVRGPVGPEPPTDGPVGSMAP